MKIYHNPRYRHAIKKKQTTIGFVGLGTVGLALATIIASKGYRVLGYDIDSNRVESANSGRVNFEYVAELRTARRKGRLSAHTRIEEVIPNVDIVVIAVPTPLGDGNTADLRHVTKAAESVAKHLSRGQIVAFESTVPIGTTRELARFLEMTSGLRLGVDFGVAVAPERYDPYLHRKVHRRSSMNGPTPSSYSLERIPRVVSGIDPKTADIMETLYKNIFGGRILRARSLEVAEASKLFENTFRNVNIALVNELSLLFSKLGLDAFEVIDAARTKPFAFMAHYPGPGVGGDCIPVVPWFLVKSADAVGVALQLTRLACEVNDSMPNQVVKLVESGLVEAGKMPPDVKIALLGLAYKKNVSDFRMSPVLTIRSLLQEHGSSVVVCDPVVADEHRSEWELVGLEEALGGADVLVMLTDHDSFRNLSLQRIKKLMSPNPIIADARNFFDRDECIAKGFIYRGIGKVMSSSANNSSDQT